MGLQTKTKQLAIFPIKQDIGMLLFPLACNVLSPHTFRFMLCVSGKKWEGRKMLLFLSECCLSASLRASKDL
jgi:hypothetical protein